MRKFEDQMRTCVDCGDEFIWTAGEQEFFHEKGFTDPPKRCKTCRPAHKVGREPRRDR
ncbi:MAG TPA: zinc-ribbon domain-containing protein [Pyrinomonadaceae bacterium]|jgi:hypothetical protein